MSRPSVKASPFTVFSEKYNHFCVNTCISTSLLEVAYDFGGLRLSGMILIEPISQGVFVHHIS